MLRSERREQTIKKNREWDLIAKELASVRLRLVMDHVWTGATPPYSECLGQKKDYKKIICNIKKIRERLKEKLSVQQMSDMQHALGLKNETGTFYPIRNSFDVSEKLEHLDELVEQEYMRCAYNEMLKEYVYKVTESGQELLSGITGVCIIIIPKLQ